MDERTLRVLEYPKIIELLASRTACRLGRRKAENLQPESRMETVRARLAETAEAAAAIERFGIPPLGGLRDITDHLKQAVLGRVLSGSELLQVADTIRCTLRVADYFTGAAEVAPDMAARTARMSNQRELQEGIERCLDDAGEVRPNATDTLKRLHSRAVIVEDRARGRMEAIMRNAASRDLLQEPIIVQRSGRFCLPVRIEAQGRLRGVVHDRSDSGATVFVEPLEVLELGNELREIQLAIQEEIKAILQSLSSQVGQAARDIERDVATLAAVDFAVAKGLLAHDMKAVCPTVREDGVTVLKSARHPLLTGAVVPINFWIGEEFTTLVITGPNTGGKTVTLKTVGLLTLMTQAGLHIPADDGSQVALYEDIWADIGDEQSIEQSLSTFSSHMTQIIKIISRADARISRNGEANSGAMNALVLLDELGAGTDPDEGAALAQAILETLHATGCRTVATTHYNDLKALAWTHAGMQNASVEFDTRSLQPTYRLLIGNPGSSNAFDIAQRLGLPRRVVNVARSFLSSEHRNVEDALAGMDRSRRELEDQRKEAVRSRREVDSLRKQYEEHLQKLEQQRDQAVREAYEKAARIVAEVEEEARRIIADLQRQPRQSQVTEARRREIAALRHKVEQARREAAEPVETAPVADEDAAAGALSPAAGDWVYVKTFSRDGEVIAVNADGSCTVQIGNMKVETPADDLAPPKNPPSETAQRLAAGLQARKTQEFNPEIDLRGMTVDEAYLDLDKYLDDAGVVRAQQVRIIHGKGTGALRQGVREYLRKHPGVATVRTAGLAEGGDGVTIAELR